MASLKLFVDTRRKKLVQSFKDGSSFTLPPIFQGAVINLDVTLLQDDDRYPNPPYTKIDPATASLDVGIGAYNTDSGATPSFRQNSFTQNSTLQKYTGTLTITEATAKTLLDATSANYVELRFTIHVGSEQVIDLPVKLYTHTRGSGATDPAPTDEYLTKAQIEQLFSKKVMGAGESITLTSPDGTRFAVLYVDDDGATHFDAL